MILRIRRYILLLCIIHSCILIYLYSVSNTKKSHDLPLPFQGQPIREDIKYYFADFVRKGGPPPPLYGQNVRQKKFRIRGVPPPPFTDKSAK